MDNTWSEAFDDAIRNGSSEHEAIDYADYIIELMNN